MCISIRVNVFLYMYACIYVNICRHVFLYLCIHSRIYMYVYKHTYLRLYSCFCFYVYTYMCTYWFVLVCIVFLYVHTYVCSKKKYAFIYRSMYLCRWKFVNMHGDAVRGSKSQMAHC